MKASEFYETHWKIDYGNGKLVSPPKLRPSEKEFLDNMIDEPSCGLAMFIRKRGRTVYVDANALKTELKKHLSNK